MKLFNALRCVSNSAALRVVISDSSVGRFVSKLALFKIAQCNVMWFGSCCVKPETLADELRLAYTYTYVCVVYMHACVCDVELLKLMQLRIWCFMKRNKLDFARAEMLLCYIITYKSSNSSSNPSLLVSTNLWII